MFYLLPELNGGGDAWEVADALGWWFGWGFGIKVI
jgi:hypothetical protein